MREDRPTSIPVAKDPLCSGRRNFLKIGLGGAALAGAAATATVVSKKVEGIELEDLPNEIDPKLFKPFNQRNTVLARAVSGIDPDLHQAMAGFKSGAPRNIPGYTQLDRALADGAWALSKEAAPGQEYGKPDTGILTWSQDGLSDSRYTFDSKTDAAKAIKAAGQLYGATLVGIAPNDPRWNYAELFDPVENKPVSWDALPFKPKSVVVIACEMNYEAVATAPSWIESATVAATYSECVKVAGSLAAFFRGLGYKAVGTVNDMGVNVAYGIMAGLGEGARNGSLIVPKFGPRVRLAKVYTEFDFVEYDKPRSFGVENFCRHCKKCADSCPSKAITHDDEPSFVPTFSDKPEDWVKNQIGVRKFHNNSEKCFRFWIENSGDCGSCIASCPYNKPDFWHHRMIDATNVISPGAVHSIMREMDTVFGYGVVNDPAKAVRFWDKGLPGGMEFGTK
jgi:epoxyqueuosine reductase